MRDEKIGGGHHDIIEECCEISLQTLLEEGFLNEIIFAVECVTKQPEREYCDFVRQTKRLALAVAVKMNDLRDKMDLRRFIKLVTEKEFA